MRHLAELAAELGLVEDHVEPRGRHVGKVSLRALEGRPRRAKFVLVTATTPTKSGEGKTVTAIGLADALRRLGKRALVTLRQPSMGPLFGAKGGGTGGGKARVEPEARIALHLTGDLHAVAAAQNTMAALVDASLFHGNPLGLDPARPGLARCLDVEDRQLRNVVMGLGGPKHGVPRQGGFVITAASETMAILCLARDHADLRRRLGEMAAGYDRDGRLVRVSQVGAHGVAAALLRDALHPNLVQTSGGAPALVHGGPFANVSHGHSSVVADRLGAALADVVVSESGFASELGAEKLLDIVAPVSGIPPDLAVLVTTVKAVKENGLQNLEAHLDILAKLGLPAIVAVNRFPDDAAQDLDAIAQRARAKGALAVPHSAFAEGGAGAEALGRAVLDALATTTATPRGAYPADAPIEDKLDRLARFYGGDGVGLDAQARASLDAIHAAGHGRVPVCVAKTPLSLSDDPAKKGAPKEWTLRVRDVRLDAGAGYVVALCGDVVLMPGFGSKPAALRFDLTPDGEIVGF